MKKKAKKPVKKRGTTQRDASGHWLKGTCPNPGGRPKAVREVAALAREYSEAAINTLADIMLDVNAHTPSRVRAAEILLERGCGRAPLSTDDMPEGTFILNITNKGQTHAESDSGSGDDADAGEQVGEPQDRVP
jgi:hypothetical protein